MFYDINQAVNACEDEPALIFVAIKNNYRDVYEKVIEKDNFNFNLVDLDGNNVLMALLKNKDYDLISKYIDDSNISINHQNNNGDTFMHLLVQHNYLDIKDIFEKVLKRTDFLPNIKNNNSESILDKSINNNYIYTVIKILSDNRFNSISLYSFKKIYEAYIKSNNYGTYSKLNNYVLIFDKLKRKSLMPSMSKLLNLLKSKEKTILSDLEKSRLDSLDQIINNVIEETM